MQLLQYNPAPTQTLAAWCKSRRFPHAILLEGTPGSGRRTFAAQIACAILCEEDTPSQGHCRHCIKMQKGIHPDYTILGGGDGAQSFHVKAVRALRMQASVQPNEAAARVFLLRDTQTMSPQAQNALLKLIEEPPNNVYFILTCASRSSMLPTILSRVTTIALELPTPEQCAAALSQLVPGYSGERYATAALDAGGNIGQAISLLASDPAAKRTLPANILADLMAGRELNAMEALEPYTHTRSGFAALLTQLRADAAQQMRTAAASAACSPPDLLRYERIIAIIDEIALANERNASGLLLCTLLCARSRAALATG